MGKPLPELEYRPPNRFGTPQTQFGTSISNPKPQFFWKNLKTSFFNLTPSCASSALHFRQKRVFFTVSGGLARSQLITFQLPRHASITGENRENRQKIIIFLAHGPCVQSRKKVDIYEKGGSEASRGSEIDQIPSNPGGKTAKPRHSIV